MQRVNRSKRISLADRKRSEARRARAFLASVVFAGTLAIGGTIAFITAETDNVANEFQPTQVSTSVTETRSGEYKKNVSIKNEGNTTAYIRAAVLVTWQDANGNVYGKQPIKDADYSIDFDLSNGWVESSDGFYYWTNPVDAGNSTNNLIDSVSQIGPSPKDGYYLSVEIVGSGIQAGGTASSDAVLEFGGSQGDTPVEIAWSSGVSDVVDGVLQIKTTV